MITQELLQGIYEKVKTPHKHGAVLKSEEYYYDSPIVFRYGDAWLMSFVRIDRREHTGYETMLARSDDLLHWTVLGQILTERSEWDSCQTGGYAEFQDIRFGGNAALQQVNGSYRFSYLGGSLKGYETDPLSMGYARTPDVLDPAAYRKDPQPALTPHDADARYGETLTLYKADMFCDPNRTLGAPYVCAYNAKNDTHRESIFLAVSQDGEHWQRYGDRAIISVFDCDEGVGINGDPQIVLLDGYYVMFYFIYDTAKGSAYNTFAVSEDLLHWTKWQGTPLVYSEYPWENVFAHKQWIISHDGVVYHYYCAVNDKNERFIALATSV